MAFDFDIIVLLSWRLTSLVINYALLRDNPVAVVFYREQRVVASLLSVTGTTCYMIGICIVLANTVSDPLISPVLGLLIAVAHNIMESVGPVLRAGPYVRIGALLLVAEMLLIYSITLAELMGANYVKAMLFLAATMGKGVDVVVYKQFITHNPPTVLRHPSREE